MITRKKLSEPIFPNKKYPYRAVMIISKAGSGKSTLCVKMIQELASKKHSQIYWISSIDTNRADIDPDKYHIQQFDQSMIDNAVQFEQFYQHLKRSKDDKFNKKFDKKGICQNIVCFDDVSFDTAQSKKILKKLLRNHRHLNCFILISSQGVTSILDKLYRDLMTAFIYFSGISIDRVENNVYPILPEHICYDDFVSMYKDATEQKYHFLYIDLFDAIPRFVKDFKYEYEKEKPKENEKKVYYI